MSIENVVAFHSAIDYAKQNQERAIAIKSKKLENEKAQEDLDLQKKLNIAKIKEANVSGQMNDFIAESLTKVANEQYKAKADVLDAHSQMQSKAEHEAQVQAQQAAQFIQQLHGQDPDVQAHVQSIMAGQKDPSLSMGGEDQAQQMSIAPSFMPQAAPQQAPVQQPQQAPSQPQGGILDSVQRNIKGSMGEGYRLNPATMKIEDDPIVKAKAEAQAKADVQRGGTLDGIDTDPETAKQQLQQENPSYYNFLTGINDGRINLAGRSSAVINRTLQDAMVLYPDLDLSTAKARFDTRKDFTSGPTAKNITALNTALHHLDRMSDNGAALNNEGIRKYNTLKNYLAKETGDPAVRKFNADLSAVTGELAGTFKQSGATDTEISNFKNDLSSSDSPEQIKATIDEFIHLIGGRTTPLMERWQNVFGDTSTFPVVGKTALGILDKHGYDYNASSGEITDSKQTASVKTPTIEDIRAAREKGYTHYNNATGEWLK